MNPVYSPTLYKIGQYEEQELVGRYGRPKNNVPTPTNPQPTPTIPTLPPPTAGKTAIIIDGTINNIEIPGYRIQKIG
jgi:hypothetical protein